MACDGQGKTRGFAALFDFWCCGKREAPEHLQGRPSLPGPPTWNRKEPLACGSHKVVYLGSFGGLKVAITVSKEDTHARLSAEIDILSKLGQHPNIVQLLYHDVRPDRAYMALEIVEPIGFDLDRLVRQYTFAHLSVPTALTRRLIAQLCRAIDYMHSCHVIHRDIKSENVLITGGYDAKLIDMGIACSPGHKERRWVFFPRTYFAPEVCQAVRQTTSIDAWGLGVVLHQIYQHRWDILDASNPRGRVTFLPRRPSAEHPMEQSMMEAMLGLLKLDAAERWSTADVQRAIPPDVAHLQRVASGESTNWVQPRATTTETRALLCQYKTGTAPLTAYAAVVDDRNLHLVGMSVGELNLRAQFGAIVLLIDVPATPTTERVLETSPKRDTLIPENAWLYFGLPPSEHTEDNVAGLSKVLFGRRRKGRVSTYADPSSSGRSCDADSGLMAFNLEFDCFRFPDHIGARAVIGSEAVQDKLPLNLRGNFGLNLAGIVRADCEPDWFPGPEAEVAAGDFGLVVRCPCPDGTTEPTVTDEQLSGFTDKALYDGTFSVGVPGVIQGG